LLRSLPPDSEAGATAARRSDSPLAERMNRVIGDLLDVASIEAGRLFVETRREAVRPMIVEAIAILRDQAIERSLRVEERVSAPGVRRGVRPGARAPGARQPHRQRDQVHARRRVGAGQCERSMVKSS